jgi:uncharacterized protein (TIRG00374 family)
LKKHLITVAKIAVPLAIIILLLTRIDPEQLSQLRSRPKDWGMLAAAFALAMLAVCITFVRWYLLVEALQIPFRLRDAFRLGFLGFLMNFVSFGSVGGDLFKAFFIAREYPKRRAEAVATVVVDRMIGLYALLLVTTTAILLSRVSNPSPALATICNFTFAATAIGGAGVLMVLIPGFTRGSFSEFLSGLPKVGHTIGRLITSVRMYRDKYLVMLLILAMSMGVHALLAIAIYLIAGGLFTNTPTLGEHLILVPLSMVAGALPFTPAGLGTFEIAMESLYELVPADGPGDAIGVLVALGYRLVTIGIASVGVVYYWTARREVQQLMAEAESAKMADE